MPPSPAADTVTVVAKPKVRFAVLRSVLWGMMAIAAAVAAGVVIQLVQGSGSYQTPTMAIYIHLATVLPAVPLGAWLIWRKTKGDLAHRIGGRIWAVLMIVTAIDSFWIQSLLGRVGPIHIFSVITLYGVPKAIWYARNGRIAEHQTTMKRVYFGMIAAGIFAMLPGRFLWQWLFG